MPDNRSEYGYGSRRLTQQTTYNLLNQPIDRKTYDYNTHGFVRSITDLKGNSTLFGINARGLVVWQNQRRHSLFRRQR